MSFNAPYRQHNFMGLHANAAACLAFVQANNWDSNKDGTGTLENGMTYYDTTANKMYIYENGSWGSIETGNPTLAEVLLAGNSAGATAVDMNSNKVESVASATTTGDALAYGQSGAMLNGLDANSQRITSVATPTVSTDAVNKDYADLLVRGLSWQETVLDRGLNTPPGAPITGDRYIVGTSPTGVWVGHNNDIAEWDGTDWAYTAEREGLACWVEDENVYYAYNGSAWVKLSEVINHNTLSGVQGGTSSEQYHLTNAQHSGLTVGAATTLHSHTLDTIYDSGGAGLGKDATVDQGAFALTTPVGTNDATLTLEQAETTATSDVMTITKLGSGGASLSFAGTRRVIDSDSGNLTIETTTSGDIDITSAAAIDVNGTGNVTIDSSGGGVYINATSGTLNIGSNSNSQNINIGTQGTRDITVGNVTAGTDLILNAGTSADITFTSRSGSLTFNDTSNTSLDDNYTATSIVGALNEINTNTGTPDVVEDTIADAASSYVVDSIGPLDLGSDNYLTGTIEYIFTMMRDGTIATTPAGYGGVIRINFDDHVAPRITVEYTSDVPTGFSFDASLNTTGSDSIDLEATSSLGYDINFKSLRRIVSMSYTYISA